MASQGTADKSAVATSLYGKEGAKLLPFMKDLAVAGDLQARSRRPKRNN